MGRKEWRLVQSRSVDGQSMDKALQWCINNEHILHIKWWMISAINSIEMYWISTNLFALVFLHGSHYHPNSLTKTPRLPSQTVKLITTARAAQLLELSSLELIRFLFSKKKMSRMKQPHIPLNFTESSRQHLFLRIMIFEATEVKFMSFAPCRKKNNNKISQCSLCFCNLSQILFTWLVFTFWNQIQPVSCQSTFGSQTLTECIYWCPAVEILHEGSCQVVLPSAHLGKICASQIGSSPPGTLW